MQKRLDHVHGLRGIAALVVVVQHACQAVQDGGNDYFRPLLDNVNAGRFGVVLFFLISGLVIPFSFRGEAPLRSFVVSRFFRLYPAYWLSIPILSYIAVVEYGADLDLRRVLANFTMLQQLVGETDIGPGYWTLKCELVFYVATALLFWRRLLDDAALNGAIVLICLVGAITPSVIGLFWGDTGYAEKIPYFIAMFFLGMLLRRVLVEGCAIARKWALALVPLAIVAGVAASGFVVPSPDNGPYLEPLPLAAGMALPIVAFVLVLWWKPVPPKWVMYLGTISYSLYLFQDIGLVFMRHAFPLNEWPVGYVVVVIALNVVIAGLVYRFVEQPMIAVGRKINSGSLAKPAAVAAS